MLDEIAKRRVFASVTAPDQLARVYVSSDQLAGKRGDDRPEAQLMSALSKAEPPQRLHVVGPSGSGKTSLIFKVLGDLARRAMPRAHEVLVVNVGDDPTRLANASTFMRTIVQLIQSQGARFASVDPDLLRAAAADERTRTGGQVDHRARLGAGVVTYSAGLKEAYETEKFGDSPARARQDFEDVVRLVSKDYRPVVLIDDTEHFVSATDGVVDVDSVAHLYRSAIHTLAEMEALDLVVAVHPHYYEQVKAVGEVASRFGYQRVDVPEIPPRSETPGLALILQRRLDHSGLDADVDAIIEAEALAQLELVYFIRGHNLRGVLDLSHAAVLAAVDEGAAVIGRRHVQPLLAGPQSR